MVRPIGAKDKVKRKRKSFWTPDSIFLLLQLYKESGGIITRGMVAKLQRAKSTLRKKIKEIKET